MTVNTVDWEATERLWDKYRRLVDLESGDREWLVTSLDHQGAWSVSFHTTEAEAVASVLDGEYAFIAKVWRKAE
jgi:uncharacterized membrane protein